MFINLVETVDVAQRHSSHFHVEVVECTKMEPFWQAIPRDNCLKHDKPPGHPGRLRYACYAVKAATGMMTSKT